VIHDRIERSVKGWVLLAALCLVLVFSADSSANESSYSIDKLADNIDNWKFQNSVLLGLKEGVVQLVLTGRQPMYFTPELNIDAANIKYIILKMKLPSGKKLAGNILFKTENQSAWTDANLVSFSCSTSGKMTEYKVDMSESKNWKGSITQLRITPVYAADFVSWTSGQKYIEFGDKFTGSFKPFVWRWKKFGLANTTVGAAIPANYSPGLWHHLAIKKKIEKAGKAFRVAFLGDSITDLWCRAKGYQNGGELWEDKYVPLGAVNLAISGDRTQHTLYHLTERDIFNRTHPEVFVLKIGINNILNHDSVEDTVVGIKSVVTVLRTIQPQAKIVLLGILPNCLPEDKEGLYALKTDQVNHVICKLGDEINIFFVPTKESFLNDQHQPDKKLFSDGLHLSIKGYEVLDRLVYPVLTKLLNHDNIGK
jgi:platelet-activating factor acetylhydrolase IB subunit beta/gamma